LGHFGTMDRDTLPWIVPQRLRIGQAQSHTYTTNAAPAPMAGENRGERISGLLYTALSIFRVYAVREDD
jgi:hypothetical protein